MADKQIATPLQIFNVPRKNQEFFKTGQLYKLRFNDPWKHKVRYSVIDVKKMDVDEVASGHTLLNVFKNKIQGQIQLNYKMEPSARAHNSWQMNDAFLCLEAEGNILRNFRTVVNKQKINIAVFKNVPVFLFHDMKTHNPIIGVIEVADYEKDGVEKIIGNRKEELTEDGYVYLENFFEQVV